MELNSQNRSRALPVGWALTLGALLLHPVPAGAVTNEVWSWGGIVTELTLVPSNLTSTVSLVAGGRHTLALQSDGSVVGWGENIQGQIDIPEHVLNVVAIAAGREHSLALLEDATVVSWGGNTYGEGDVPAGLTNVASLSAGSYHNLALLQDGSLVGWGDNSYGQLDIPTNLPSLTAVAAGRNHNLALSEDGSVLAWGQNSDGQATVPDGLSNVVAIAAGGYHSLALKDTGEIIGWGGNDYGQSTPPDGLSNVVAIAAGDDFSLALRADGTVVGWEQEIFGAVDVPGELTNAATADVVTISAGLTHSLALASERPIGFVYPRDAIVAPGATFSLHASVSWRHPLFYQWLQGGLPIVGATNRSLVITNFQLAFAGIYECVASDGQGATNVVATTVSLVDPQIILEHPVEARVAAGDPAFFSVTANCSTNTSFQWRLGGIPLKDNHDYLGTQSNLLTIPNAQGQHMDYFDVVVRCGFRGAVSRQAALVLQPVAAWGESSEVPPGLTNVVAVGADGAANFALDGSGAVREWDGNQGVFVIRTERVDRSIAISTGAGHRLALRDDGTVVAWGDNAYGQASVPVGLSNVIAVAAGGYHSLALRSNGTVVAWGANWSDQATAPQGLSNVTAIAAGLYHNLALAEDGTVTGWGANASGQSAVPNGLTGVKAIAAGGFHSLALLFIGDVVAWGENEGGQIEVPSDLENVAAVAAGAFHSLAVREDGTVEALGINQREEAATPPTLTNVVSIFGAVEHSLALVSERPTVTVHPFSPMVAAGGTLTLRTRVTWFGPVTYQWARGMTNLPGATNATLTITNFQAGDTGEYRCVVQATNGVLGEATSTAYLRNPSLISQAPSNSWTPLGAALQLMVAGDCPGPLAYEWRRDGITLVDDGPYLGTTTSVLTISAATPDIAGNYTAVVRCGSQAAVSPPAAVEIGRSVAVAWDPSPGPDVAGYRICCGERSREYSRITDVGLTTNHVIGNLEDGTLYYIAVTAYDSDYNISGFSDEIHYVTPGPPKVPLNPSILEQPIDQVIGIGSNATFRVVAEGAGTLLYQWHKDGVALTNNAHFQGTQEGELRVQQAGGHEAGSYSVVVTNVISGAASSDARLRVHVPPVLLPPVTNADGTTLLSIINSDASPLTPAQAYRYWIQARTNLTQGEWTYLNLPMNLDDGVVVMEDPESLVLPQRFFRAMQIDEPFTTLRLQAPKPLPGGNVQLCLECAGDYRALTPTEVSALIVEATDDPSSPTNWNEVLGPRGLVGGQIVLEDDEAAMHAHRFYRARMDHPPPSAVRLHSEMVESNGIVRLVLGRADGLPLGNTDVFNYEVLVSDDALDPLGWSLLPGMMGLTNGMLQAVDASTNQARFYRVYAR